MDTTSIYKIIFNQLLNPRNIETDLQVNNLWSNISPDKANFTPNHIVPIVFNHIDQHCTNTSVKRKVSS